MKITKFEHSGVAIEKGDQVLVFDPVEFDEKLPTFENVVAIVLTHKHSDHYQPEVVARILQSNPGAKIFTTLDNVVDGAVFVQAGDAHQAGDFKLDFFGKDHACILPGQVPCANIGVVVDDMVVNPGDSFDLPSIPAKVLLTPIAGPWSKVAESIDFVRTARPVMVIPIHDAVLSKIGKGFNGNWLNRACSEIGTQFVDLAPGQSVEV